MLQGLLTQLSQAAPGIVFHRDLRFRYARISKRERSHEISLWTADAATRLRTHLRRGREPDGRTIAPLLAAGLSVGRAQGPAEKGEASRRGDRRLPRQKRTGRRARAALRAPRRLARVGSHRGKGYPLLLSRLALRHTRPVPRHAVRDRRIPQEDGYLAGGLSDPGIRRIGLRVYGPARHRALVPDVRHRRHPLSQRCRVARHAGVGRILGWLCQGLQLAAALREHRRSVPSPDAAQGDQRRPVCRRDDAGIAAAEPGEDLARRALSLCQRSAERQPAGALRRMRRAEHVPDRQYPRTRHRADAQGPRVGAVMGRSGRQRKHAGLEHRLLAARR